MDWCWRGRMPYAQALEEQRSHRRAILEGRADSVLWLLEHDPVVTTGRRVPEGTASVEELAARSEAASPRTTDPVNWWAI